ncbi:MAG TPA: nucleotidyltransferase domain-containing protein [Thermoanaerobacterales bacterium]|nr:nucleotidyltransferase domain-containing protein [Thermoanaerobacterales bacterium]
MHEKSSNSVQIFYPEFSKKDILNILLKNIHRLNEVLPLAKVILFGSYAKGRYSIESDVDLLIVYKGDRRSDVYSTVKKILRIPRLEPHIYSEGEYEEMKDTIEKMLSDGCEVIW